MKQILSRVLLAIVALAVVLSVTAPAPAGAQSDPTTTTPSGTNGAPVTPSGDPAIDDLVGCVQGARQLLVLFLIDESASLKVTDPDNRRVDAARGALDSLIALASSEGEASPNVDVALAAFSNEYRIVKDWTPAGTETADSLTSSLDEFAAFNKGIDTDFVNALSAGREALADQAAEVTADGGTTPCRAVMLFTDGGYDLAVRTNEKDQKRLGTTKPYAPGIELTTAAEVQKAETAGRKELCDPGGLADRLRGDDVTLLTVALSGDVARRSQLPLAAATTGKADDYTCGTQPEKGEEARVQGAYLPAEDIDVLVTQFNGVGTRLAGGNLVPGADQVKICGDDPCEEGTRTFTLDESLRRAQILALPPKPGASVVIQGPGGDTATVEGDGSSTVGTTDLEVRSIAGRGFAIDLTRPTDRGDWDGEWKVSIIDPSGKQEGDAATLQVFVFSDIGVAFGERAPLERGASTAFEVVLEMPEGVEAADVVKSAAAQVRLLNPVTGATDTVELKGEPSGPFTGTFATPPDTTSNVMEATAEVRITTVSGAVLVSQSPTAELRVLRPKGSVQFTPGSLKMPSLTGEGATEIGLDLVGGTSPGCVWFGKADVSEPPEGVDAVEVTLDGKPLPGKSSCIEVAPKQKVTVTIEATPSGRGSGAVLGNLQVFEKTDRQDEATTTEVPFRFDMARGVDQAQRLLLSVLLLALGLGLPVLLLLALNAATARFQVLDAVQGAAVPVLVSGKEITRVGGPHVRAFTLRPEDFGSLAATGSNRRFTFSGVEFRAKASRNPFRDMIALAAPEGGAEKLKGGAGSRVELDAGLAGSWVFLLDSDTTRASRRGEAHGLLLAFVAEGDVLTQTARMLPDINARLPETADRLARLVRTTKTKPSKKQAAAGSAADADADADADGTDAGSTDVDEGAAPVAPPADTPAAPGASATDTEAATEAATPDEAPAGPAAPVGFGGNAASGAIDPRRSVPASDADPGDDDPGGAPAGFTGARPS